MARTLCILPLIAVAAYLAWSPPEAAGSAPTAEAHSALPLVAVSPSDSSDAGWPLDADVATTISTRAKPSKARSTGAPSISAAPTASSIDAENANDSATTDVDDASAQPIEQSTDQSTDDSGEDRGDDRDNASEDANARPATTPVRRPLNSDLRAVSTRVRRVLNTYYKRQLNSRDHNPWEMMHAIIAYGVHTKIHRGGPKAPTVNAVSYLCWNGTCHGLELLYLDKNRVNARKGPYVQGHYAQLLAILAQSRVPKDYPLRVGDRKFTIADLIETEKLTCDEGMELTFKLISFSHYCDSDMTWKNDKGEDWDIPRLIQEELKAPILSNAACGGTHRLTALAYAVRNRAKQGHEIDGAWLRAQKYLNDYHRYNFSLQNSDGSFSTEWFRRREARDDLDRRLQTSGHILEWFVYSLPEEQLTDPRVVKAVKYLSGILAAQPSREWEIGPLGHAIHALSLYDQRVFKTAEEGARSEPIAERRPAVVAPRRHEEASRRSVKPRVDAEDAAPSLSIDPDEPAPVIAPTVPAEAATSATPTDTAKPATSREGPDLFGAPPSEEASSTESESTVEPAIGPALGAPASVGDSFGNQRPAAGGANIDPPPALPDDEPAVAEPPARQPPASQFPSRRRPIAPPVVAEESGLDEFAPDESASEERILPDDIHAYDVRPDDDSATPADRPRSEAPRSEDDSTVNPGTGAPGSSRRPRANSRYARPLPDYSTYPGGQPAPPPHAQRRPLPGGQSNRSNMTPPGRNNTAPSLRGSIPPRELAPQGTDGSRPAAAARQPAYRPPANRAPANRPPVKRSQSNSNRSMSNRSAAERPPARSIWPWTDEDRGGQSGRGGERSSNKRSRRGLFQGN